MDAQGVSLRSEQRGPSLGTFQTSPWVFPLSEGRWQGRRTGQALGLGPAGRILCPVFSAYSFADLSFSVSPSTTHHPQAAMPGNIPSEIHLKLRHLFLHLFSFKIAGAIK